MTTFLVSLQHLINDNMKVGDNTYTGVYTDCGITDEGAKKQTTTDGDYAYINIYSMKDSIKVNITVFSKILELSPVALKVLNAICNKLEYNNVNVSIEINNLAKSLGHNRVTISNAVKELVEQDFIKNIKDNVKDRHHLWKAKMYALNTSLIYKGSNKFLYERAHHLIEQQKSEELLVFIDD